MMNLEYIDIEMIIKNKDKESVKYFLILFINILKLKEIKRQNIINRHFNNKIAILKRRCLTERENEEKEKNNKMDISFDNVINKMKKRKNIFLEILNNWKKNNKIIKSVNKKPNNIHNLDHLTEFNINKNDNENKEKFEFKPKNSYIYFLSQKDLINEILKLIKDIMTQKEYYEFLNNNSFNKIILNIIKKIYLLEHNNTLISKQFLLDNIMDINDIITKELYLKNNSKAKENINVNINVLSDKLRKIRFLKIYKNFKYRKGINEIKVNKLENEYQSIKSFNRINKYNEFYNKLISYNRKKDIENLELKELLMNIKYLQKLEKNKSIINNFQKSYDKTKKVFNKISYN